MKKAIVITTINPPTEALLKFVKIAERDDWIMIIVGDQKTPHEDYDKLEADHEFVTYLHPDDQESKHRELSDLIGWNCIQRRNFGFIFALEAGAEVIATVDDDNIPFDNWGKDVKVGRSIDVLTYPVKDAEVFDPLAVTHPHLWHRGFPVQLLDKRDLGMGKYKKRKVLVQADFWNGDPDVDAIARITLLPHVMFDPNMLPFAADKLGPFNSQNTFLHKSIFPTYFLFPHVGRMDDIWASYITQHKFPESVIYSKASVFQERNEHDLVKDLEAEMMGYRYSKNVIKNKMELLLALPQEARDAYEEYIKVVEGLK